MLLCSYQFFRLTTCSDICSLLFQDPTQPKQTGKTCQFGKIPAYVSVFAASFEMLEMCVDVNLYSLFWWNQILIKIRHYKKVLLWLIFF